MTEPSLLSGLRLEKWDILSYVISMNRETLGSIARVLFGWGWQSTLARGLGVDSRSVRRWGLNVPVPGYVEAVLESLLALSEAGKPLPPRWRATGERRRLRKLAIIELERMCRDAFARYRVRALDNIALPGRVSREEALVVADALESQGDVMAFKLGRRIRELARQC